VFARDGLGGRDGVGFGDAVGLPQSRKQQSRHGVDILRPPARQSGSFCQDSVSNDATDQLDIRVADHMMRPNAPIRA
jgi:hypothetical protein